MTKMAEYDHKDADYTPLNWLDITIFVLYTGIFFYLLYSVIDVCKLFIRILITYRHDRDLIEIIFYSAIGANLLMFRVALSVCKIRKKEFVI